MINSMRALSSLSRVDYADIFDRPTEVAWDASPEGWARAMFGDVPSPGEALIWRVILGLRLRHGRSPDTIAGWRIAGRGDGWVRMAAESWFLSAELVTLTEDGRVSLATFLRYDRPIGRLVWPPLSAVHRALVPRVLRAAERRVRG